MDHDRDSYASSGFSFERTAMWVEAQARQSYNSSSASSPPPTPSSTSTHALPSNRTTASSEQELTRTISRRRAVAPPPPSPSYPYPSSTTPFPVAPAPSSPYPFPSQGPSQSKHTRSHRSDSVRMPFPQGPPGSGYPLMLEVGPPRPEADHGSRGKSSRPSIVKKRRPSLLGQIKSLGAPNVQWKRDDNGK